MKTEQEHNNVQWRKVKLGDCLKQKPDYGINAPAVPYDNNLPTYLRITDITEDGCYSKKDIVSVANQDALKYVLEEGDLVFARTGASVGKTYLYDSKDGMLVFAGFLIRVKTDENVLLPEFFKYQTHTPQYKNWIAANSMRTGQPGINGNEYEEFSFSIPFKNNKPDLTAQRRIAAILSAADKVIDSTRRLIEKYKKMKQGMMEDLLTPKEGWKMVKLGECLTIGNGQDYKHLQSGEIPVYGTGGVMTYVDDYLYDGETVCIGRKGTINKPIYHTGKIWTVDTLFYTHSFVGVVPLFIYYIFCNVDWNKYNEATGVPSLSKETIYKIELSIPNPSEQHRIAAILSGLDAKIAAEEKVLEKYEKVKKGLMERLLETEYL